MMNRKNQKLTVYLIKEGYDSPETFIKTNRAEEYLIKAGNEEIGTLYVKINPQNPPKWADFFAGYVEKGKLGKVATTSAVLLIKEDRYFAITFGHGRQLLQTGCWEERFGLLATLNCIDDNKLRSIDKKNLDMIFKQAKEQAGREATAGDFGLDVEQDLLRGVVGQARDPVYGSRIGGMDSFHVIINTPPEELPGFVQRVYNRYDSKDYKTRFPWVDQIAEVKSGDLASELDNELAKEKQGVRPTHLTKPERKEKSKVRKARCQTYTFDKTGHV